MSDCLLSPHTLLLRAASLSGTRERSSWNFQVLGDMLGPAPDPLFLRGWMVPLRMMVVPVLLAGYLAFPWPSCPALGDSRGFWCSLPELLLESFCSLGLAAITCSHLSFFCLVQLLTCLRPSNLPSPQLQSHLLMYLLHLHLLGASCYPKDKLPAFVWGTQPPWSHHCLFHQPCLCYSLMYILHYSSSLLLLDNCS